MHPKNLRNTLRSTQLVWIRSADASANASAGFRICISRVSRNLRSADAEMRNSSARGYGEVSCLRKILRKLFQNNLVGSCIHFCEYAPLDCISDRHGETVFTSRLEDPFAIPFSHPWGV